eukprot:TRINITY_DN7854_c0_g1_i1.p2 TRINITY_DN7854_c0_g1~~TRINITY_DN7854_c0_g1_i1.p2  ORF type:complete len:499 (-),score=97.37 TRINITY_DN7854_c0_g1_i1:1555-3051(-)
MAATCARLKSLVKSSLVPRAEKSSNRFISGLVSARNFCSTNKINDSGYRKDYALPPPLNRTSSSLSWLGLGSLLAVPTAVALAYQYSKDEEVAFAAEVVDEERLRQVLRQNNQSDKEGRAPIYRIVLTGGPCGGKSTALSLISDRLRNLGFRVFVVPEAATVVITGGGIWKDMSSMSSDQQLAFEGSLMKTKMALEDAFYSLAEATNEPSVIICDRGTMDTAAYLPQASWEVLLHEFSWNMMNLRDRRYDAVIHLVSAAIGAEKYYTTENNAARSETVEQARSLDFKILNAWVGHPSIRIIDNSTDFQNKIKRVITQVCQVVGAPKPFNYKRKFMIADANINIPVKYEQFEVEQTYLINPGKNQAPGYNYLRRRGQNGSYHYSYSELRDIPDSTNHEKDEKTVLERQISGREYIALQKQADPERSTVKKRVKCFVYNNQYIQLSTFLEPNNGISWIEIESVNTEQNVDLPPWLGAMKEVTENTKFTSYEIAKDAMRQQ